MSEDFKTWAIAAYQQREYDAAINVLVTLDENDWQAQLYLAMSYYQIGRMEDAQRAFFRIKGHCPDKDLRDKAELAFAALRAKVREDAEKERARQKAEEEEVEW